MTENERLHEAIEFLQARGYVVHKKLEYEENYLPCICGHNKRTNMWKGLNLYVLQCKKCGLEVTGRDFPRAKINWNRKMKELQERGITNED